MQEFSAPRQVTRLYAGFTLHALEEPTGSGNWTGNITNMDRTICEYFLFSEKHPTPIVPTRGPHHRLLPVEATQFAQFCVDVSRARI